MIEKINKGNIFKHLIIFYEYAEFSVFNYFMQKMFEICINSIKSYYLSDDAKLDFFKEDSKKSAEKLTNCRNTKITYLENIENFIY